jgi:hypothetical protein
MDGTAGIVQEDDEEQGRLFVGDYVGDLYLVKDKPSFNYYVKC